MMKKHNERRGFEHLDGYSEHITDGENDINDINRKKMISSKENDTPEEEYEKSEINGNTIDNTQEDEDILSQNDDQTIDDEDADAISHLVYLLRQMINKSGFKNYFVTSDDYNISIQFILNKSEKMNHVIRILGLLKKISKDILIQYESELDLWETKDGNPLLTIDFYYDDDKNKLTTGEIAPF